MNVAIIGTRGIGKFHVKEFNSLGCKVVAIAGQTEESTKNSAEEILKEFKLRVKPYWNLDKLIEEQDIEAVSICTPLKSHFELSKKFLERGINVLCEKPFVENLSQALELFEIAKKNKLKLSVNTQWSSIKNLINIPNKINNLMIYMESGNSNIEMLTDHLPHLNSILISLLGNNGIIKDLKFLKKENFEIILEFTYKDCKVRYHIKTNPNRPREIIFKINDEEYQRKIGNNYQQFLFSNGKEIKIEDPLKISIRSFVNSIKNNSEPLVNEKEIIRNLEIQIEIIRNYKL